MTITIGPIQQLGLQKKQWELESCIISSCSFESPSPSTSRWETRELLSVRSSRKWPIHTRAISLIRAEAWPGVPSISSLEYITFHSPLLLSEEPDITQGQKAERSHPNKTHLSAGRLVLLSVGIKRVQSDWKCVRILGNLWKWLGKVRRLWFIGPVSICPAPHQTSDTHAAITIFRLPCTGN